MPNDSVKQLYCTYEKTLTCFHGCISKTAVPFSPVFVCHVFSCQEALQNIAREIEIHVNPPRHHYALLLVGFRQCGVDAIYCLWQIRHTLLGDHYATSRILLNRLWLHWPTFMLCSYDYLCVIHIDRICPWLYTFFALQFLFRFFNQLLKQYLGYFVNIFDL